MDHTPEYRPTVHFTPDDTWMNDPNGLLFHKGQYHMFFQSNPTGRLWGNIGWGHAVSKDLVEWQELPTAIPATTEEMAFSGSAVWDRHNTSGLGSGDEGPLVAFFTSAYTSEHPTRPRQQAQSIAYSVDGGDTWTRYEGNPVIDRGSADFRDPKVFWHGPTERWAMVVVEAKDRQVLVYTSPNLLDWEHASSFGPVGEEGVLWECPDLIEVPIEGSDASSWVLLLSTNPGGYSGGSGMRYFVGDFDGETFTQDLDGPRWLDYGPDFYAAVSFHGADEPLIIAWMANWLYSNDTPTFPWQSAMTVARRLSLVTTDRGLRLRQRPVLPDTLPDGINRFDFALDPGDEIAIETGEGENPSRVVLSRTPDGGLILDRSAADPHGVHGGIPTTNPIPHPPGTARGVVLEDHGLIEVFLDDGLISISMQTFPVQGAARIITPAAVSRS